MERSILWSPWDEPGLEHLCLSEDAGQSLEVGSNGGIYKYEDEGLFQGFTADLPVDSGGLVTDYPKLFRRVWVG